MGGREPVGAKGLTNDPIPVSEEGWPAAASEKLAEKTGLGSRRRKLESDGK